MNESGYQTLIVKFSKPITELDGIGKATQLCPFWPRRIIPFG